MLQQLKLHAEYSNSTTNYLASFPGSVGSLESVVHTDHILITFIMMNHPLTYYLSVTHCGGKTYGKIIGSTRQTDTAVLTIHSTIYGGDSDGLEKCNLQAVQMSGALHQMVHLFTCAGIQKTWAPRISQLLDIPVDHDKLSSQICSRYANRVKSLDKAVKYYISSFQSYGYPGRVTGFKRAKDTSGDVGVSPDTISDRPGSKVAKKLAHPYKNGYVQHMCCAYGAVNAAHVQAALMCRTCASFCHTSYMRNMYVTCVRNMCCLHTCKLQVCCTRVCCMYAYYYSAAYMPLAHMQPTSVPHIRSLHTCILLQCCVHATCTHATY